MNLFHENVLRKKFMNKNGESYSSTIESHRKRRFGSSKISRTKSIIFDVPIPNDPTPVLQPTPWRPSNFAAKSKKKIKKFFTKGMQKIKDFGEWLLNYIPQKPKLVDKVMESFKNQIKKLHEKRDTLFEPTQSKSVLKNFAIQYRMEMTQNHFCLTLSSSLQTLG